ncbi:hypothetical protein V6N13_059011 [Hibiscus sabdariffa]|uniref:Transmembrane protein n=1 Tax=Hibiscus sabdariffa TaxID=183260 RepID=A0ABR2GEC3_9ROSI
MRDLVDGVKLRVVLVKHGRWFWLGDGVSRWWTVRCSMGARSKEGGWFQVIGAMEVDGGWSDCVDDEGWCWVVEIR